MLAKERQGIYVLRIEQSRLDGQPCDASSCPKVGQVWSWEGTSVRLDGPPSTLLLGSAIGAEHLSRRAARVVRRKLDVVSPPMAEEFVDPFHDPHHSKKEPGFTVSDGETHYLIVPLQSPNSAQMLLSFPDGLPPAGCDFRVVRVPKEEDIVHRSHDMGGDVICFSKGTRIRCDRVDRPVENLVPGDLVQTKDDGLQEVLWIGQRRMSGARLFAIPQLRPVRLRANAIDSDIPDADLLVSPHHRILLEGAQAQALFNQSEVLVSAIDLIDDQNVFVDHSVKEVWYYHLLLQNHSILWANGVQTESYHPANTTLKTVDPDQRALLLALFPEIKRDPHAYGPFARRNVNTSEAAILKHAIH